MSSEFTKYEAIEFLGQVVRITKRWESFIENPSEELLSLYDESLIRSIPTDFLDEGDLCRVDFIEDNKGHIFLTLSGLHDDDLRSFDKADFEQYCQVLKPEFLHASAL